jgi:hypothetical protein
MHSLAQTTQEPRRGPKAQAQLDKTMWLTQNLKKRTNKPVFA